MRTYERDGVSINIKEDYIADRIEYLDKEMFDSDGSNLHPESVKSFVKFINIGTEFISVPEIVATEYG